MTNLYSKRYNHLSAIAVVLILLCLFLTSCSGAEVIRVEEQKKAQIETYKVSQTEETVSNTEKNSFRISKEEDTKSRMLVLSNIKIDYSQLQVLSPYESIELLQGKGLIVTGIGSPNRVKTYNSSKFNTIKGYTSKELDLNGIQQKSTRSSA